MGSAVVEVAVTADVQIARTRWARLSKGNRGAPANHRNLNCGFAVMARYVHTIADGLALIGGLPSLP